MILTDKARQFCAEYLKDLNAGQAAIRAGYSAKSAYRTASRMLADKDIQAYLAKISKKRSLRTAVTQDRVLTEISRLAFNDPRRAFDDNGALLPVQDWPDDVAAAIASIECNEIKLDGVVVGMVKKVKFWDKSKNLELAARHLGMLNDKLTVTIEDEFAQLTPAQLLERATQIRDRLVALEQAKARRLENYIDAG